MPETIIKFKIDPWVARGCAWILGFSGFILSSLAAKSCRFIKITGFDFGDTTARIDIQYVGLFRFLTSFTCVSWDLVLDEDDELSSSHVAARAFGVLAPLFGGLAMLALILMLVIKIGENAWRAIQSMFFASFIFQSLTFVFFNDERCKDEISLDPDYSVTCAVDEGGAFAIAAMCFYILAGISMVYTPAPSESPLFECTRGWTVEKRETEESSPPDIAASDGASGAAAAYSPLTPTENRTVTETYNPDGSKTTFVTTTTIPPASMEPPAENTAGDTDDVGAFRGSEF